MAIIKGRGVTLRIDGELLELKHGDEIPSSVPKDVRDAIVAVESRGLGAANDALTAEWPKDATPPVSEAVSVAGIEKYDDLKVGEVVDLVTVENAAEVKAYEEAHRASPTVLKACDAVLDTPPAS